MPVKKYNHLELNELSGAGSAKRLLKAFNKHDLTCQLFVYFGTGGIDFVGGFSFYQLMKRMSGDLSK